MTQPSCPSHVATTRRRVARSAAAARELAKAEREERGGEVGVVGVGDDDIGGISSSTTRPSSAPLGTPPPAETRRPVARSCRFRSSMLGFE